MSFMSEDSNLKTKNAITRYKQYLSDLAVDGNKVYIDSTEEMYHKLSNFGKRYELTIKELCKQLGFEKIGKIEYEGILKKRDDGIKCYECGNTYEESFIVIGRNICKNCLSKYQRKIYYDKKMFCDEKFIEKAKSLGSKQPIKTANALESHYYKLLDVDFKINRLSDKERHVFRLFSRSRNMTPEELIEFLRKE